jgi:twitching motility protein PilT
MDPKRLEALLAALHRVGASALHLVPGRAPNLRVQRRMVGGEDGVLQVSDIDELIRDMLFADHRELLVSKGFVEVLYCARDGRRYRATITALEGSHSLVLRPVPECPPKFEGQELPEQLRALAQARSGLVLVAGFFGSGKSTTLAVVVDSLNQDSARHIVTIEGSIDFLHPPAAALLHQREVGVHVATAAEGVRQAVALGVDTLVVTEIQDAGTLDAVLTAAESGCLVIGGVEAGSVVGALSELSLLVPVEQRARLRTRIARSLRGIVAQSLLQRSHRAGRVPVVEILVGNPAARNAIRLGDFQELPGIMQRCRGLGMQTADIALRGLLARHLVSQEEALLHAADREQLLTGAMRQGAAR